MALTPLQRDVCRLLAAGRRASGESYIARRWHAALEVAAAVIDRLPDAHVGQAVLTTDALLFTGGAAALEEALANERLVFHQGRLGGALPQLKA